MTSSSATDLTRDAFLGGRVMAWQPARGFRSSTDAVFLAAACPARAGETVLELGCGAGVAALCLMARVAVTVTGVERQAAYAALARRNAVAGMTVVEADLRALPPEVRGRSYDHVIANPPYYVGGPRAHDTGRDAALREETPLAQWLRVARARLAPGGWLTVIQAAARLPEILGGLDGFGAVAVRPLAARAGRAAGRVVVRARKGARAPFALCSPLVVHHGPTHLADADDFSPEAAAILRDGAAMVFAT